MTNPMTETGEKGLMEIPEDVIKAATEFQDMVDRDPKAYVAFDVAVLAILAERERCSKVAYTYADEHSSHHKLAGHSIGRRILFGIGDRDDA